MPASTRDGILETMSRYVHAVDDRDFATLLGVFAGDATFSPGPVEVHGAEAVVESLRQSLGGAPPMRHVVSSVSITEHGDGEASAVSDWVMLSKRDGEWRVADTGRYHDRLRRSGDAWVFTEKRIVMAGT